MPETCQVQACVFGVRVGVLASTVSTSSRKQPSVLGSVDTVQPPYVRGNAILLCNLWLVVAAAAAKNLFRTQMFRLIQDVKLDMWGSAPHGLISSGD